MNWLCTLVVCDSGRVRLEKYRLVEMPLLSNGYVKFVEAGNNPVFWNPNSIRTMEIRPVTNS